MKMNNQEKPEALNLPDVEVKTQNNSIVKIESDRNAVKIITPEGQKFEVSFKYKSLIIYAISGMGTGLTIEPIANNCIIISESK